LGRLFEDEKTLFYTAATIDESSGHAEAFGTAAFIASSRAILVDSEIDAAMSTHNT